MEVIGTSKMLVINSSDEKMSHEKMSHEKMSYEKMSYEKTSYQPIVAPPNTPITATPPNTPLKSKICDKMVDISTVSITDSFSLEESPENRRKSVPTGNMIIDTMSPDLPKTFNNLKIHTVNDKKKMVYNPDKYTDDAACVTGGDKTYAQSSPNLPRAKMSSPDVSPITSEFNSIDDEDEGRFSDFMKVFGREQEQLNRFVSDEEMLQMQDESDVSYVFEDSKSFLNNVREISYEDNESLLH